MPKPETRYWVRGAIIAAAYVVITASLAPISYGAFQVRVAEALTVLPILYPEAIAGLFVGCLIANTIGPFGLIDIIFGSSVTLLAAVVTYRLRGSILAYLSPIVLNAFLISIYVSAAAGWPYWFTVLSIGAGQSAAVLILGWPLIQLLKRYEVSP